ncbi:MAG: DUF721 domain-containing protein [Chlamydiota bacterium]
MESTNKQIALLLPKLLSNLGKRCQDRPDLILASWSGIVGEKLAPMAQAVSFSEGVLTVRVKNSTLYSLLMQHEKTRLLKQLREKFPAAAIRNIIFRMG